MNTCVEILTNEEKILNVIYDAVNDYENHFTTGNVNYEDASPEDPELCLVINGRIMILQEKHIPANYIDGQMEYMGYSRFTRWTFIGIIQLINENGIIVKEYDFNKISK